MFCFPIEFEIFSETMSLNSRKSYDFLSDYALGCQTPRPSEAFLSDQVRDVGFLLLTLLAYFKPLSKRKYFGETYHNLAREGHEDNVKLENDHRIQNFLLISVVFSFFKPLG